MVAHGDKLGQGVWVRLVWWPLGKKLGTGSVGMVGMVAHGEGVRDRECG